jgi:hypothetical protein
VTTALRKAAPLIAIVALAIALRLALLAVNAFSFNSDEAVLTLMARHILQGERPAFFYGQTYMGSLDAYLVAGAFALAGESVLAERLVQVVLYAVVMLVSYGVARRITGNRHTALMTALLYAIPPVLLTLYTTVSQGGHVEMLLVGSLTVWLGLYLESDTARMLSKLMWLAWGLLVGLEFWIWGLGLAFTIPTALWLLWRMRMRGWRGYLLAALGFALGSTPWWLGNLSTANLAVMELLGRRVAGTATAGNLFGDVALRVFNFIVLGLPVLFGLRFPWSTQGPPSWLAVLPLTLYLGALGYALRKSLGRLQATTLKGILSSGYPSGVGIAGEKRSEPVAEGGRWLMWGIGVTLFVGFALTPFGGDPTGRYFQPLYLPLFVFTADALEALHQRVGRWAWLTLAVVLIYSLVGTVQAALTNPPGITTQFEAITDVNPRYDAELMDFLRANGGTRGYSSYWASFRIAFLSHEEIILVARLPYKADLRYTSLDDRYPPYDKLVEDSGSVVYVTTNHPVLDELLRERFSSQEVKFREKQIGDYHVFYGLSRKVAPEELNIVLASRTSD